MRLLFFSLVLFPLFSWSLTSAVPSTDLPDLVRIRFANGWVCSGIFIDPFTVLTSAHCLLSNADQKFLSETYLENEYSGKLAVSVVQFIPHPEYSAQFWHSSDVGVIKTSRYAEYSGAFTLAEDLKFSAKVKLLGCGRTEPSKEMYLCTTGENTAYRWGGILFLLGESSIVNNDSGGPMIDLETQKIIAVNSTTTVNQTSAVGLPTISTGTSTVVEPNLSFVKKHMGANSF